MSFQRFFRELHRHLLLPARYGIPMVSSLSILLLLSIITGLVTYKKFWRGFFRRPQGGSARRLSGYDHDAPMPHGSTSLSRLTQRAYPNLQILELRLPRGSQPLGVFGQADAVLVRDRVNGVWIDPDSGRALQVLKGESLSMYQRLRNDGPAAFRHLGWNDHEGRMVRVWPGDDGARDHGHRDLQRAIEEGLRRRSRSSIERQELVAPSVARHGRLGYVGADLVLLSIAMMPGWLVR